MIKNKNEFNPDYATSPGETLLDAINALGMSQTDLAARAGKHKKTINEVIKGKSAITPETAIQLERILGVPASFWNNRQIRYDEFIAKNEEYSNLQQNIEFLDRFPLKEMVKYRWIPKVKNKIEQLSNLLSYFQIASPQAFENYWQNVVQPAYRLSTKFEVNNYALAAWLRKGEIEAQSIECKPYNRAKFEDTLSSIRALTCESPEVFIPEMQKQCSSAGVAVVFVPELPGTRVCGAARWLPLDNALIQLSLRYKKDDHFWFTFFHEAKHILQDQKTSIILDETVNQGKPGEIIEKEDFEADADRFAARFLIPSGDFSKYFGLGTPTEEDILEFAEEQDISPGIVVGQLQHKGKIPWNSKLNKLKKTLLWPNGK